MTVEVPTVEPELAGFTYSKKKSRKPQSKKAKSKRSAKSSQQTLSAESSVETVREKYNLRKAVLLKSDFFKDFQAVFSDLLASSTCPRPKTLKMLGIGTLSHNPSLTQLAFGLELAKILDIPSASIKTSDPMYTETDRTFLAELEISVEPIEIGNQDDVDCGNVMIFAPHVPKSVYETLLRTYWHKDHFSKLLLLGNNLKHYPDIYSNEKMRTESPAILEVGELLDVIALPGNFEYNNVFNDLAIQWLRQDWDLPDIDFGNCPVEKEHFEINQDEIKDDKRQTHIKDKE